MIVKASYSRLLYVLAAGVGAVFVIITLSGARYLLDLIQMCGYVTCGNEVRQPLTEFVLSAIAEILTVWRAIDALKSVQRRNERRQAAARGESLSISLEGELATSEPYGELALPTTIRLRLNWRSRQLYLVFGIVFIFLQLVFACTLFTLRDDPARTLPNALAVEAILMGILAIPLSAMWFGSRQRIDVSDEGLRVRRYGMTHRVRWSEARLFGLVGIGGGEYELASQTSIVRWWYPRDTSSATPTIPLPDYLRQMDALLLLVEQRTQLPLYHIASDRDKHSR